MKRLIKIKSYIQNLILSISVCSIGYGELINVEYKTLQLSYIQTDRAAGILKALGYAVIDFSVEQGPNPYELLFQPNGPFNNSLLSGYATSYDDLPLIIILPETENITLLEMAGEVSATGTSMDVDMGGSSLVYTTTGEPLQRLMIVYDPEDPYSLSKLISLISNEIDVPAIQVMIEALVIEINSGERDQLGVRFESQGDFYGSSFAIEDEHSGVLEPFTFVLDKSLLGHAHDFKAELSSLISNESANILSRPSVLVLDGRQARIVVGQQIPTIQTTASSQFATTSTEYIPVGIVLNIRPRVSSNRDEITIQVETIISETEESLASSSLSSEYTVAPTINSRKVQSYVQVANNTPFIIGGLISNKVTYQEGRVPFLSSIPWIGNLFKYKIKKNDNKEVIVVITPHIVDVPDKDFTRVIPKDSEIFQSLGNMLFQNSYRIQNTDVFDLGFVLKTPLYENVKLDIKEIQELYPSANMDENFNQIAKGALPGQEILIRRMLYNLVERVDYYKYIDPAKIIYFASADDNSFNVYTKGFKKTYEKYMDTKNNSALVLTFQNDLNEDHTEENLKRPVATVSQITLDDRRYKTHLKDLNDAIIDGNAVMLHKTKHERRLYEIFVLRRVLEMNPNIQENISSFTSGLEILFPSPEVLHMDTHVLDNEIAKYFYEINDYNNAFDKEFLIGIRNLQKEISLYD
jgi:Flp pilus assembly secretin CpaC